MTTELVLDGANKPEIKDIPVERVAQNEAAHQAQLLKRPEEEWKARMESFVMTRVEEEVISNLTAEQKAALPQYTRDQHAAKLVARGEKP